MDGASLIHQGCSCATALEVVRRGRPQKLQLPQIWGVPGQPGPAISSHLAAFQCPGKPRRHVPRQITQRQADASRSDAALRAAAAWVAANARLPSSMASQLPTVLFYDGVFVQIDSGLVRVDTERDIQLRSAVTHTRSPLHPGVPTADKARALAKLRSDRKARVLAASRGFAAYSAIARSAVASAAVFSSMTYSTRASCRPTLRCENRAG